MPAALPKCGLHAECLEFLKELFEAHGETRALELLLDHRYDKCYGNAKDRRERVDGRRAGLPNAVRFGVRVDPQRAAARNLYEWEKVFHGTKADFVPSILKLGYLLKVGDETPEGAVVGDRDNEKILCGDGVFERHVLQGNFEGTEKFAPKKNVFTTPSLAYAGHDIYSTPIKTSRGTFKCIFEMHIKPDTFSVGPQTIGKRAVADPSIDPGRFEYYTERHGVLMITGLIVVCVGGPSGDVLADDACPVGHRRLLPPSLGQLSAPGAQIAECPTAMKRWAMIQHVGINPYFFNHTFDRCYCGCQPLPDTLTEGPEGHRRKYVLPKPLTRFAMHVDEDGRPKVAGAFDGYHTCYHGTVLGALKPILECGYLIYPGSVDVTGKPISSRAHNSDPTKRAASTDMPSDTICVSPSITYASDPVYAARYAMGGCEFHVVLQFKIKPDSYRTFPSTLTKPVHDRFVSQDGMEWHTKRHGTLMLYGILVGSS